jgi:UPF0271 protein
MDEVVAEAVALGVRIGAHPGYPDRAGFGRVRVTMAAGALEEAVCAQVGALAEVARVRGASVTHVKPHGALYHAAMGDEACALAVAAGVERAVGREGVALVGRAGAAGLGWWRAAGWRVLAEGFADRRYGPGGELVDRGVPGAVVTDPRAAARQGVELALGGGFETLCVHGDGAEAAAVLGAVRAALLAAGVAVEGYAVEGA